MICNNACCGCKTGVELGKALGKACVTMRSYVLDERLGKRPNSFVAWTGELLRARIHIQYTMYGGGGGGRV